MSEYKDKEYIGDSVYIQHDGFHIILTTENGLPDDPSNKVALSPNVIRGLLRYCRKVEEEYDAEVVSSFINEISEEET